MPPLSRDVPPSPSPASAVAGGHGHGSRKDGSRTDGSRTKSSCASRYGSSASLPSRLSRAQSLQFKPSVTLTFCPHIIFSGMVSGLADHALVLLIVSLRA